MDFGAAAEVAHPASRQPHDGTTLSPPTAAAPLDFGFRFNGSNDTARETRVQNYDGEAPGTGANLDVKLHF